MTIKLQIYKCTVCRNLVQILQEGDGNLVCCGQEMELQNVQYDTTELGEKHTPKIVYKDGHKSINVLEHPMSHEHYIQFIEAFSDDKNEVYIKFFKPEDKPEADISFFSTEQSFLVHFKQASAGLNSSNSRLILSAASINTCS